MKSYVLTILLIIIIMVGSLSLLEFVLKIRVGPFMMGGVIAFGVLLALILMRSRLH